MTTAAGAEDAAVRALVAADSVLARRRQQRRAAVAAIAASSILPFVALQRPALVPPGLRALALVAWGTSVATALAAGAAEWRARRRMVRCADALAPTVGRS